MTRILTGVLVVALLAMAGSGWWLTRHLYFQAKLARLTPVDFHRYASANAALGEARAKPRVVLIGDSRILGWSYGQADTVREIVNRGIPGETSAQLGLRFAQDALALRPAIIVIQTGGNDLVAGMGTSESEAREITSQVETNLKTLALRGHAAGARVLVMTVIPPTSPRWVRLPVWHNRIFAEIARLNAALLAWQPPEGIQVIDLTAAFKAGERLPKEFARDELHLNASGYAVWSSVLDRALASAR